MDVSRWTECENQRVCRPCDELTCTLTELRADVLFKGVCKPEDGWLLTCSSGAGVSLQRWNGCRRRSGREMNLKKKASRAAERASVPAGAAVPALMSASCKVWVKTKWIPACPS